MQRFLFLKTSAFPVTEGENPTGITRTRAGIRTGETTGQLQADDGHNAYTRGHMRVQNY